MRAGADDERRKHAESSTLLPAHVVFLLDELGHGQLLRRLEDEFASVRSFCALAQRARLWHKPQPSHPSIRETKVADCLDPRGATVERRERGRVLTAGGVWRE